MRVGLFPVLIFASGLMISVKIGTVWQGMTDDNKPEVSGFKAPIFGQSTAVAQEDTSEGTGIPSLDEDELLKTMSPAETIDEDDPLAGEDLSQFTSGERILLHELVVRRNELNSREQRLQEREALLRGVEMQLLEKQERLIEIKAEIDDLLKVYQEEQRDEAKKLINIYSNMKPKSAAQIFNEMDMDTLLAVLRGMKERKIAPIMAAMAPDKARLVTRELAEIRKLPELPQ